MERRQEGARLLAVTLFRADNKVYRIEAGTGAPVRDAGRIVRLFADRLAMVGEACDPGFGYDMVRLAALIAEPSMPEQTCFGLEPPRLHGGRETEVAAPARSTQNLVQEGLAQDGLAREGLPGLAEPAAGYARSRYAASDDVEFSHLLDRLGARFGLHRVIRLLPQDTHIPEFAVIAVPWVADRGRTGRHAFPASAERPAAFDIDGFGPGSVDPDSLAPDSLGPARPIRLFGRPEPVEALAEIPDGPPARFRWRRVLHEVTAAEGPERIAMEWWRDAGGHTLTRDYFRVESRDGLRAWLYREGVYGTGSPRWFLHGLFG
jgi:protein ImuB